jgi:hypothetical protein
MKRTPSASAATSSSVRPFPRRRAKERPSSLAIALLPQAVEELAAAGDLEEGAAELAMIGRLHLAAGLGAARRS